MAVDVLTYDNLIAQGANSIAWQISTMWNTWNQLRNRWRSDKEELRRYLFATDTTATSNAQLPWKNKTTLPKLTQIRDNLHANYIAALFPNDEWLQWVGEDQASVTKEKRTIIENYMRTKLRQGEFIQDVADRLALDYIDFGNAFAMREYVIDRKILETGETVTEFEGVRAVRIHPFDIVFNPIATSFEKSPKIVRSLVSIGDLVRDLEMKPELDYDPVVVQRMLDIRHALSTAGGSNKSARDSDRNKSAGLQIDGFSSIDHYYGSGYVEILEFYGDLYNMDEGTLMTDRLITVVDRNMILRQKQEPSWAGEPPIFHAGWRTRPDNLWAMGPLDNLVGMQYRIDHLENLKADIFDVIAHPILKIRGTVEDFEYEPGARAYIHDDGDIDYLAPDPTALNADTQIAILEAKMEEFAGAPKEAAGIRTPGEKTKFEVAQLQNAASRIFQVKLRAFEKMVEDLVNSMFSLSVQRLNANDVVRVIDDDFGVEEFLTITKEDVTAKGRLRPQGARHFAAQAQIVQNLTTFFNTSVGQDPAVRNHMSGKRIAKLFEEVLGLKRFELVSDNIGLREAVESERFAQAAAEQLQVEGNMPVEEGDIDAAEAAPEF